MIQRTWLYITLKNVLIIIPYFYGIVAQIDVCYYLADVFIDDSSSESLLASSDCCRILFIVFGVVLLVSFRRSPLDRFHTHHQRFIVCLLDVHLEVCLNCVLSNRYFAIWSDRVQAEGSSIQVTRSMLTDLKFYLCAHKIQRMASITQNFATHSLMIH